MSKKILSLLIFCLVFISSVNAANWQDLGQGMYIDKDGLSNKNSDTRVLVIKYTNPKILDAFKYMANPPRQLSVCAIQETLKCSNSKMSLDAILCYDSNGQAAVDMTGTDLHVKGVEFPFDCEMVDTMFSEEFNSLMKNNMYK